MRHDRHMSHELDRTADAAIACALQSDAEGMVALVQPLPADELRRLSVRLAARAADALTAWAADLGVPPDQTLAMWQNAILRAELHENDDE
jgi:hypothetical protein